MYKYPKDTSEIASGRSVGSKRWLSQILIILRHCYEYSPKRNNANPFTISNKSLNMAGGNYKVPETVVHSTRSINVILVANLST